MTQPEDGNTRGPEGTQSRWEKIGLGDLKSPFASDPNDRLLTVPISDWFPSEDPVALLVLQFLVAWRTWLPSTVSRKCLSKPNPKWTGMKLAPLDGSEVTFFSSEFG